METKVLTPKGFVLLGDVRVGQQVCNPDGTVARVIAVWDRGEQEFFRVTLQDGAMVEASADHLWAVSFAGRRRRCKIAPGIVPEGLRSEDEWNLRLAQRATVVTTRELRRIFEEAQRQRERDVRAYAPLLPLTAPVAMTGAPGRWPVLPPYTLGVLLGDGSLNERSIRFVSEDEDVAEAVRHEIGERFRLRRYDAKAHCATYAIVGAAGQKADSPQALLRRDGLLGCHSWEKFIPERLKAAPVSERFAVIQGLFDTDGHMDDRGHVEFVSVSERLARDAQYLLRSLGYRATLTTKLPHYTKDGERVAGRVAYRLYVQGPNLGRLFRLDRKAARVRAFNGGDVWPAHRVVSVEPSGRDRARCITVDHPNGLYVTDDFIVTHNSDALLMAALQYVDTPGYAALIFRRTYADLALPGALMDRSKEWLAGTAAVWNEREKTWTFPSGATVSFGYLEHEQDKYRYQGSQVQLVCFDELTQFGEGQYRYLFSRLRRLKGSAVPLRMRAASNPGGAGHAWVRQRFLIEGPQRADRLFIPATLDENPHLDREEYVRSLQDLDPYTRQQLLAGDWFARPPGQKFRREWFPVVDAAPATARRLRYWDLAATEARPGRGDPDWTAGALLAEQDGRFWVCDIRRVRATPRGVEALVRQTAELDGRGVDIWMEQEPGSSGVKVIDDYARRVLAGWAFRGNRTTGSKEVRANPLSAAAEAGNVLLVRGAWISDFLDEAESFPGGEHDDQVDAVSGALTMLTTDNDVASFLAAMRG